MANIKISDIKPAGVVLLNDSESYLNDLTDEEIGLSHKGGATWTVTLLTLLLLPSHG